MPTFTSDFHELFDCRASPETALATFTDPTAIMANHGDVEHAEDLGDGVIRWTLSEQNHGVAVFAGRYAARYTATDPSTLKWVTQPSDRNMSSDGTATFEATPAGCRIDYRATITIDMDVGRMLAAVVRPIFARMAKGGVRTYVERMIAAAERR